MAEDMVEEYLNYHVKREKKKDYFSPQVVIAITSSRDMQKTLRQMYEL